MKEKEQPIDPALSSLMNEIGALLAGAIKDHPSSSGRKQGFALFVFDFGQDGRINYISNANRADMLATLKEFIAKAEGRFADEVDFTKTKQ